LFSDIQIVDVEKDVGDTAVPAFFEAGPSNRDPGRTAAGGAPLPPPAFFFEAGDGDPGTAAAVALER
jgi:hypothetical protein